MYFLQNMLVVSAVLYRASVEFELCLLWNKCIAMHLIKTLVIFI